MNPAFFNSLNLPKNSKIAIDGLERNIPGRKHSHNAAWVRLYRNMIQSAGWTDVTILGNHDTYDGYDALIIYLGISYNGNINFFFGIDDNVVRRFARIQDFEGPTFVLNHDMPLIGATVRKRLENKSTSIHVGKLKLDKLDQICEETLRLDYVEKTQHLCFGDSHCFSAYKPGYMVCRNDGLTLFGALRDGLKTSIEEKSGLDISSLTHLTLYMGNIDIRHHLMRQDNPYEKCSNMVVELGRQLQDIGVSNVEIVEALPIESEERKLPKSGYYKGTPFYGSWAERNKLVDTFNATLNKICIENNWSVFRWPQEFLNEKNELDFEYMERPKSVHLSPLSYRWDLFNNVANSLHKEE